MAFITCPRCGKQTTDIVDRCIYCGCGHKAVLARAEKRRKRGKDAGPLEWLKITAVFFAVAAVVYLFGEQIFFAVSSVAVTVFGMIREVVLIVINV